MSRYVIFRVPDEEDPDSKVFFADTISDAVGEMDYRKQYYGGTWEVAQVLE